MVFRHKEACLFQDASMFISLKIQRPLGQLGNHIITKSLDTKQLRYELSP